MPHRKFGVRADGETVTAHEISSRSGLKAVILNQGAILQALYLPDGRNVTLGFEDWEGYAADQTYKGRLIGRNANRIIGAKFQIASQTSTLMANDGRNNLHSGPRGLDTQLWDVASKDNGLQLKHVSPDGHDGFPGEVEVSLRVSLHETTLRLEIEAKTSQLTPVNPTWHPYWNLAGTNHIDSHDLRIESDQITELETARIIDVRDTRFDFQRARPIGSVQLDANYNHANSVTLTSNDTQLRVTSSLPDMQIYTGDHLPQPRNGIAIEPQFRPNDINLSQESLLSPREIYRHWIEYQFATH